MRVNFNTCKSLITLGEKISLSSHKNDLGDLLSFMRWNFYQHHLSSSVRHIIAAAKIVEPRCLSLSKSVLSEFHNFIRLERINWGDYSFHLKHRIHLDSSSLGADFSLFFRLVPIAKKNENDIRRVILEGVEIVEDENGVKERHFYDLSVLPLNLLLGKSVVNYFIPPNDYLKTHPTKKADPYGIVCGFTHAKIARGKPSVIIDDKTRLILGAHKFGHSFLLDLDFNCPIGCSDCYKTRLGTREYLKDEEKLKIYNHPELGELNPPTKRQIASQVKYVVHWMNTDKRGRHVYDVILSGGEPLCLTNETFKIILNEFQNAKKLRILRICTGTIFLGLPFRIDDELLDLLKDFSDITGVRVTIQVHLGNHHMISPEAVIAVQKIRQRGIPIYSQIPIKNGINFFLDDFDKTIEYLIELNRRQVLVGVEPYAFIVDMHPSTNAFYVPIEPLMQTWGTLVESHDYPGLERPRTLSVLFEGGNIILSGHALFSAKKKVDKKNDRVIYRIPRVGTQMRWKPQIAETFEYEEPLIEGINDDPKSLDGLKGLWQKSLRGYGRNEVAR